MRPDLAVAGAADGRGTRGLDAPGRSLRGVAERDHVAVELLLVQPGRVAGEVLGQPAGHLLGGHRPGEQIALDEVAVESLQDAPAGLVLDALGDDAQTQVVAEVDDRADDRAGRRAVSARYRTNSRSIFTSCTGRLRSRVSDE